MRDYHREKPYMWSIVGAVGGFLGGIWLTAYLLHILPIDPYKVQWFDIPIFFTVIPIPIFIAVILGFLGFLIDED